MDESNSYSESELQLLLAALNDKDPGWFTIDEFDDLLSNLQALEALIWATSQNPLLWKWVVITAHATLQSVAVCKLTRTDGFGAMSGGIETEAEEFYKAEKDTLKDYEQFSLLSGKEEVANFPALMRRLGYKVPKSKPVPGEDPTNRALYWLHDFRSTYAHFPPVSFSVKASVLRSLVEVAVKVIRDQIEKGDWQRSPRISLNEVIPLLDSIKRRLGELSTD
ncbi:MAG: hypothetical protein CL813_08860 [Confluentimicrobium sp.]|nr:hypothetical protein [Actibacterium sp.]MBF53042.1 hypothetical protein [Actibacterium sp.]